MNKLRLDDTYLKIPCATVNFPSGFGFDLAFLAEQMINLMKEMNGVGLAANQVGDNRRLFVAYVPDEQDAPQVYVNPVLTAMSKKTSKGREGCLSLPNVELLIPRHNTCGIEYQDLEGSHKTSASTGLLARVWQHEVDHLNGILITDRVRQG